MLFNWILKKARREACRQLVVEIMRYNPKDGCWDPIGSIDKLGMDRAIAAISTGTISDRTVEMARALFTSKRKIAAKNQEFT